MSKLLSAAIMAHPSRSKFFPELKARLGDVPLIVDEGKGLWDTAARAWAAFDLEAKYHVVIQDDAIICDNFYKKAEAFIQQHDAPNRAFSFYFGNRQNLKAYARKALKRGFAVKATPTWGVAICLPTSMIVDMLARCNKMKGEHDDTRIGTYLFSKGAQVFFPMPSLVDHRMGEESLVGDPGKFRHAMYFIDDCKEEGDLI